jgi:hypothetical protein
MRDQEMIRRPLEYDIKEENMKKLLIELWIQH